MVYSIGRQSFISVSAALILYEADKLSTDALLYIKWLLERYKGCNYKVFFCCSDVAKLQAIKTICTVVELLPPSKNEVRTCTNPNKGVQIGRIQAYFQFL